MSHCVLQEGGELTLSVGERHTILDGLSKLPYGFARQVEAKLNATKCIGCKGCGFAPYVGGDDDVPCAQCNGSGWNA